MNSATNPLSLPARQQARKESLTIRLSTEERVAVKALATRLQVPLSQMARHFLMNAVAYHSTHNPESEKAYMASVDPKPIETQKGSQPDEQAIDMVAVYSAVLRALVYLDQKDYTEKRQTGVQQHDGSSDPASANDSSQG